MDDMFKSVRNLQEVSVNGDKGRELHITFDDGNIFQLPFVSQDTSAGGKNFNWEHTLTINVKLKVGEDPGKITKQEVDETGFRVVFESPVLGDISLGCRYIGFDNEYGHMLHAHLAFGETVLRWGADPNVTPELKDQVKSFEFPAQFLDAVSGIDFDTITNEHTLARLRMMKSDIPSVLTT